MVIHLYDDRPHGFPGLRIQFLRHRFISIASKLYLAMRIGAQIVVPGRVAILAAVGGGYHDGVFIGVARYRHSAHLAGTPANVVNRKSLI